MSLKSQDALDQGFFNFSMLNDFQSKKHLLRQKYAGSWNRQISQTSTDNDKS